ncbi:MAG: hypothetical protein ACTHKA_24830 [Anaerocolumna jejuensis]
MSKIELKMEKVDCMINFDEEIAKFQPSLEVDQAEEVIHSNDLSDITDIIKTMLKEIKDRN